MSNKMYDVLKIISLICIPLASFVASLADIWGIPYGNQIVATITACGVLCGGIVVVAKKIYDKEMNDIENLEEKKEENNG